MGDNFVPGLVVGFTSGVITLGIVGFAYNKIRWCLGRVKAVRKPQDIKTVSDKTPWQVMVDGCKSLCTLIILLIIFFACVVGVLLFAAVSISG